VLGQCDAISQSSETTAIAMHAGTMMSSSARMFSISPMKGLVQPRGMGRGFSPTWHPGQVCIPALAHGK